MGPRPGGLMPVVSRMTSDEQRDWLSLMADASSNPPTELGVDIALDVTGDFDVIFGDDFKPMLVYGLAALIQALLLALEMLKGSWWFTPFGSRFGRFLGTTVADRDMLDEVLGILKAETRIVDGTETVRVTERGNRQWVEAEFTPHGVRSPFTLYAPVRRGGGA